MRKILIVFIFGLLVTSIGFHQAILATIDFYRYQYQHEAVFTKATITWKQLPFTTAASGGRASDSLTFGSLQLPVPYGATKHSGSDAALAVGYTELITVTRSSAAADFFRMYNFSEQDTAATCTFLSRTSGRGACDTNYDLYHAFLELNHTDIHAFSPIKEKELFNRLLTLRAEVIPGNTVAAFATDTARGFLFYLDDDSYQVTLFDLNDQQYHLEFSGIAKPNVTFVLSNIKLTNQLNIDTR